MTTIYLIRHAEAEGNLYRIAQGQCNSLITDCGYRQIAALKKRFENVPVDAVYSSDLYRTCITAGAVYLPKHLPLNTRKDLREICVGDWEEKTWGQIAREDPEMIRNFSIQLDQWHVPGAETPEQVRDRVLNALRQIVAENDGKTVAVFSHGCVIRILLATLQGFSIAQMGQTPLGSNTAVSLLEADGGRIRVVYRDDASHLSSELPEKHSDASQNVNLKALKPGLLFKKMNFPQQKEWLQQCVQRSWVDSGETRTLDVPLLLAEADERPTFAALETDGPVGVLQLNPDKEADKGRGWISLYCVDRDCRRQGYGIQLMGQAVQYYRPLGRNTLTLAIARKNCSAVHFFEDYGFVSSGEQTADGRGIWTKDISFHPIP